MITPRAKSREGSEIWMGAATTLPSNAHIDPSKYANDNYERRIRHL